MKTLKTISIFILCLWASSFVRGQQTITIAEGTTNVANQPISFSSLTTTWRTSQSIYPASMMEALIGSKITKMTFYRAASGGAYTGTGVNFRLGTTTTAAFTSTSFISSGLNAAFAGAISVTGSNPYTVAIQLSTPFPYTGDNLVIDAYNQVRTGTTNTGNYIGIASTGGGLAATSTSSSGTHPTGSATIQNFLPQVTFEFEPDGTPYSITTTIAGSGSVNFNGTWNFGQGAKPTYIMKPDAGYMVQKIEVDNVDVTDQLGDDNTYKFPALAKTSQTMVITFAPLPEYTIIASAGDNGTIDPSGSALYTHGTSPVFRITPDPGYAINEIIVDNEPVNGGKKYTFPNLKGPHTIHVTFKIDQSQRLEAGYDGNIRNPEGSTYWFLIFPNSGSNLVGGGSYQTDQVIYREIDLKNMTDCKITALTFFVTNKTGGTIDDMEVVLANVDTNFIGTTNNEPFLDPPNKQIVYRGPFEIDENGLITIELQEPFIYTGKNILYHHCVKALTGKLVTPNSGHAAIDRWQRTPATEGIREKANATTPCPPSTGNNTYNGYVPRIQFTYELSGPTYTVTASKKGNGTISPPGETSYKGNATPTFIIEPDPFHEVDTLFVNGEYVSKGDLQNAGTGKYAYTFDPLEDNATIYVIFKELSRYHITATFGAGGSIDPPGQQTVYQGESRSFKIVPDEGYKIDSLYIDGLFTTIKGKNITLSNITKDRTIHAVFKLEMTKKCHILPTASKESSIIPLNKSGFGSLHMNTTHTQIVYPANELSVLQNAHIVKITFYSQTPNVDFGGNEATVKLLTDTISTVRSQFIDVDNNTSGFPQFLEVSSGKMEWYFEDPSKTPFVYKGNNLVIDISITGNSFSPGAPNPSWLGIDNRTGAARFWNPSLTESGNVQVHNFLPRITIDYATYSVTAGTVEHGEINPPVGKQDYNPGETPTYIITPDPGYEIDQVLIDGTDKTNDVKDNGDGTFSYTVHLTGEHTMSVTFKAINYTITYYRLNGADNSANPATYTVETPTFPLADLELADYVFEGWYDNEGYDNTPVTEITINSTGDKKFWARWNFEVYDIIYHDEKNLPNPNITEYTVETETIELIPLELEGYIFEGWFNAEDVEVTEIPKGSAGNIELWAKWSLIDYTIAYHNLSGADNSVNPETYTIETPTFTLQNITGDAGDFGGWFSNEELTEAAVAIEQGSIGDKEFWAKWLSVGITDPNFQNVHVYSYRNSVYIVNNHQVPLTSVEITDITGRMIYHSTSVQSPIHLKVAGGQYIVRIMSKNEVLNTKIIIKN